MTAKWWFSLAFATACSGKDDDTSSVDGASKCDGIQQESEATVDAPFDVDGDGYFDGSNPDCVAAYGEVDCDDSDGAVNPGASEETCNGVDDDCDATTVDDGDNDGDGYGGCVDDCDDFDPEVHPDQAETLCNGIDDDCNKNTPDSNDFDGDGYSGCDDCDDDNKAINPGQKEIICNGIDDDCAEFSTPDDGDNRGAESHNPALSCADVFNGTCKAPGDGTYWLDPTPGDLVDVYQAYCDMYTDGGGWTLVANVVDGGAWKEGTDYDLLNSFVFGTTDASNLASVATEVRYSCSSTGGVVDLATTEADWIERTHTTGDICTDAVNWTPSTKHFRELSAHTATMHTNPGDLDCASSTERLITYGIGFHPDDFTIDDVTKGGVEAWCAATDEAVQMQVWLR